MAGSAPGQESGSASRGRPGTRTMGSGDTAASPAGGVVEREGERGRYASVRN